jgi:hypothetical protein
MKTKMNLKDFNFPEVTAVHIAFPTFKTDKQLLEEAKYRGFYNGNTPYNKLFNKLFFEGGKVKFKKKIDKSFFEGAWLYCRAFMGSFEPKHEEKEAICAMLLSELVDI